MIKACAKCGKMYDMMTFESVCYQCRDKEIKDRLANDIKTGARDETFCEDVVFCPWCGDHYEADLSDGLPEGETECGECGKHFMVTCDVTVSYSTKRIKIEGNDG